MKPELIKRIFEIKSDPEFRALAFEIFNYQARENILYKKFIEEPGISGEELKTLETIPFLPIEFFKNNKIFSGSRVPGQFFESSGTSGSSVSRHYVADTGIYEQSFLRSFRLFYDDPSEFVIAALLPSYMERKNSSLVFMVDSLIRKSGSKLSGFYRDDIPEMLENIKKAREGTKKIILIGVSYALLDLAEKYSPDLSDIIVMETGGMKGMRKEMIRSELHSILKKSFNVSTIHSEYGMTELLSQAWSKGEGVFYCPPWMKILIRDPQDPLEVTSQPGITGGINVIDLANIHSCSFIATGDLGKLQDDGGFEVLGRLDNQDIRGCNLLID
jgi:phenylacetate-coenzyme A ligase PaaK-like adenylate-forming protein